MNIKELKEKYRSILRYDLNRKNRKKLKKKSLTLLSSNCIGGVILHELGLRFDTPTINLYFEAHDFVKFLCDLDHYLKCEMKEEHQNDRTYPVGRLDDLHVYFVHYGSFEEAKSKWMERVARMDLKNLYIIMVDRDGCNEEDRLAFDRIPYPNKAFLTYTKRPDMKSSVYLKGSEQNGEIRNLCGYKHRLTGRRWIDDFDYVSFLNS